MNSDTEGPSPQNMALFGDFAKGYINTQLLLLSARLQLPEILSHGAKSLHELTLQTQCDGPVLKRFLRGMVSLELVKEIEHDLYDKGPLLCMVNNLLGPGFDETSYQSWSKAMHTLKTGKPGWNEAFGQSFYDYLDQHPQKSQEFDQWNANSLFYLDTILNQYDFGQFKTLVDLGGGSGSFLIKLLEENPHLHGTIFDREEVIKNTNEVIKGAGPVARIQTQPGSFFDKVPNGADAYTICRVLLNWDDNQVIDILKNCKAAMNQTSKLLILDFCIPGADHPAYPSMVANDLNLLVNFGGASRTTEQWYHVVESAGLKIQKFDTAPNSVLFLLEAVIG